MCLLSLTDFVNTRMSNMSASRIPELSLVESVSDKKHEEMKIDDEVVSSSRKQSKHNASKECKLNKMDDNDQGVADGDNECQDVEIKPLIVSKQLFKFAEDEVIKESNINTVNGEYSERMFPAVDQKENLTDIRLSSNKDVDGMQISMVNGIDSKRNDHVNNVDKFNSFSKTFNFSNSMSTLKHKSFKSPGCDTEEPHNSKDTERLHDSVDNVKCREQSFNESLVDVLSSEFRNKVSAKGDLKSSLLTVNNLETETEPLLDSLKAGVVPISPVLFKCESRHERFNKGKSVKRLSLSKKLSTKLQNDRSYVSGEKMLINADKENKKIHLNVGEEEIVKICSNVSKENGKMCSNVSEEHEKMCLNFDEENGKTSSNVRKENGKTTERDDPNFDVTRDDEVSEIIKPCLDCNVANKTKHNGSVVIRRSRRASSSKKGAPNLRYSTKKLIGLNKSNDMEGGDQCVATHNNKVSVLSHIYRLCTASISILCTC